MMTAVGQAFAMVFEPYTIMVMVIAALYGLFVGAVPGLTATMATALLVPVTFFMPPIPAIAAMVTATAMAIFSGDIPGCLLRIPGTPASAAYTDEAFAMTRKGEAETALGAGLVFSAVGGLFGTAVLILAAPALAREDALEMVGRIADGLGKVGKADRLFRPLDGAERGLEGIGFARAQLAPTVSLRTGRQTEQHEQGGASHTHLREWIVKFPAIGVHGRKTGASTG